MIQELKGRQIDKAFAEGEVITSNLGHDDEGLPIDEKFYAGDVRFAGENEAAEEQLLAELRHPYDPEMERKITALYNKDLRRRYEEDA